MEHGRSRGQALLLPLAMLVALGNLWAFLTTADGFAGASSALLGGGELAPLVALAGAQFRAYPAALGFLCAAPLVFGIAVTLIISEPAAASSSPEAATAAEPEASPAVRLLALLQEEARFVDFIGEDLDAYEDAQVGAAAREIHAGCRKALRERIELQRILTDEEGSEVTVEAGFDPAAVRLTGNVAGEPPFRGTLQHPGWRASGLRLPESAAGVDPTIITPAEVEIA
jgi:hypothetical protein